VQDPRRGGSAADALAAHVVDCFNEMALS